jgi:hypothetical protein
MQHFLAIHVHSFHNSNNIWGKVQIIKLFMMHFHSLSYYFQPQKSKDWITLLPNPVYSLFSVSQNVTPTFMKMLWIHIQTHTHTFIFQQSRDQKERRRAKFYEYVVSIAPNSFPLNFLIPQSVFLNTTPKYFKFPSLPKFQTI